MLKSRILALVAVLVIAFAAMGVASAQDGTIIEVAQGAGTFNTLLAAVDAAGLTDVLNGEGPFTVFAPTDEAFAALPPFVIDYLLANPELLTRVLTYHVVSGAVMSTDLTSMMAPSMEMSAVGADLMGSELNIVVGEDGSVKVDQANVVTADIAASNGVIHVIDSVLLPPLELPEVVPATVTGDIISNGSSTVEPVSLAINARFADEGYSGQSTVIESGTGGGFAAFCEEASSDIANASRPIRTGDDSETANCLALTPVREPLPFRVGTDALAVVVSPNNTWLSDVTIEQLGEMFLAENWSDLSFATADFPAEPIQRFIPGTASGTFDYFVEEVYGDAGPDALLAAANTASNESDNVLVQGIQESDYSLGFFGYAYYADNADTLKVLSVDGITPSAAAVDAGTYEMARPLFIYSTAAILNEKPQVAAFINYFLTNVNDVYASGEVAYFPSEYGLRAARLFWLAAVNFAG